MSERGMDPAEADRALSLAGRARQAGADVQPLPAWYGWTIAALMVMWLGTVDAVRAFSAPWLFAVTGSLYCLGVGIAIGVWRRQGGVVPRLRGPWLAPSIVGSVSCALVGSGTLAAGLAAGFLLAGTVAGLVMGACFVTYLHLINRRIVGRRAGG